MNKVMNEENRRRGGRNTLCRLFRSGRWFLCLALLCSVMLPELASAAEPPGGKCTDWNNSQGEIQLKLPPSVTIKPGQTDIPPIPPVTVKYKCSVPDSNSHQVALYSLADANALVSSLGLMGLTLKMTITDSSGGAVASWTFPAPGGGIKPEFVQFGESYKGTVGTGERTMTIRATLSRNPSQSTKPGFYAIPSLTAFRLKPDKESTGTGPALTSPAIRLQYVPTCFVKTSVPPFVKFGPVMTTDVDNSFSRTRSFQVSADTNANCNGMDLNSLKQPYKVYLNGQLKGTYYLKLPLKVSFVLNNGGVLSSDNKSIILHNSDGNNNGLQLQITGDNGPVTFGDISTSGDTQPPPANQFSEFNGESNTWNVRKTYNAVLTPTGDPVKTGKYSAQVTVKVEYY